MRIYIASTIIDLEEERNYLFKKLQDLSVYSDTEILIENSPYWVNAQGNKCFTYSICKDRLGKSDYCILLLGGKSDDYWYYGWRPKGSYNPKELSITELEYEVANENSDCQIIPLIRKLTKEDIKLLKNKLKKKKRKLTQRDKHAYERFEKNCLEEYLFSEFRNKEELLLKVIGALFKASQEEIASKSGMNSLLFEEISNIKGLIKEIVPIIKETINISQEKKNRILRDLQENEGAIGLFETYKSSKFAASLMTILFYRRNGRIGKAEKMALQIIEEKWPEFISGDVSTIPSLSENDYNILCNVILQLSLNYRFKIQENREENLKKALFCNKICHDMIRNEKFSIQQSLKGRALEILSSTYIYCGLIEEAKQFYKVSVMHYEAYPKSKIKGTEQRIFLLEAILALVEKDESTLKKFDDLIELRIREPHPLGITVCRVWKALYYNSVDDKAKAKQELMKIEIESLAYNRVYDPLLDYFYKGAENGATYNTLCPKIDIDQ